MNTLNHMVVKIIREQELVIGPLAWIEANKVSGLTVVDQRQGEVALEREDALIIDGLVDRYTRLFGRASREVCRDAVASLIAEMPKEEVPVSLRN